MNIAICDDEKIIREQIKNLIEKQKPDCCLFTFASGEELIACDQNFDIIFLDIQMKGINGIEAAKKLRRQKEEGILIFITGIKEYVFEAFDVAAFHYLLKPVEEKKFTQVFCRAVKEIEKRREYGKEQLFIKIGSRSITLEQSSVLYIESRGKKAEIHTTREIIEIYASMKGLEGQLGSSFYRCHRGYLVNMAYITEYGTDSISLNNGETIYLSKDKYNEFVKVYMKYLRNGGVSCV